MRLAAPKPSPPTRPAAMHVPTTRSNMRRKISLSQALLARTREHRVIRYLVLKAKPTEPTIGEVELDLAAQHTFRADGKHVANNQHPDHQHRIDRRSSGMRIVRRQLGPNPRQIENAGNGAHQ